MNAIFLNAWTIFFFGSVFTRENLENIRPPFEQIIVDGSLSFLQCSVDVVTKWMKELKTSKSPGPDGIHPLILKKLRGYFSDINLWDLQFAVRARHDTGLQEACKLILLPLHYKDIINNCKNYHQVSLISILCKVWEKFCVAKNIFISDQFRFMKVKSSLAQLVAVFHDWVRNRNNRLLTGAAF